MASKEHVALSAGEKGNRSGMSHLEVIFAFVIFVGAVLTIFYFFNLRESAIRDDAALALTVSDITQNISVEFTRYSVVLNQQEIGTNAAIAIQLPQALAADERVRIEDADGKELRSVIDAADRSVVHIQHRGSRLVYVLISTDIEPGTPPPESASVVNNTYYRIVSSERRSVLSEKRISALKGQYDASYDDLRRQLRISPRRDFGMTVKFTEQEFIKMERSPPSRSEVAADNQRKHVLRKTQGLRFADVTIELW